MEGANGALLSINSLQDTEKKRGCVLVEERAKKEISVNNAPHLSQNGKRYLHQHTAAKTLEPISQIDWRASL